MNVETDALEDILKENGVEATPSAMTLLKTCSIHPEDLLEGIRKDFPDTNLITTRVAAEIVMRWPRWRGISPAMAQELKGKVKQIRLALPRYLIQTLVTLQELEEATPSEVANKTGRKISTEKSYLSNLFKKRKVSRRKEKGDFIYKIKT